MDSQEKQKLVKSIDSVVEIDKVSGFVISADELKKSQQRLWKRSWKV